MHTRRPRRIPLRTLTAGLFASVDGVAEAPHRFPHDSFDPELGAGLGRMIGSVTSRGDAVLTYARRA
ncbi:MULTISPECIES: hypothetical protein [Clavibacter]|uniref:Dihydrofolate reductase n=1 Tax=Clavibacter tessellarius TaxID=31965 RepID=A0A154UZ13_9MICO|nr:hypothetical protein AWH51_00140 [Clavibacter michiganensis subsp. tessellarius]